VTIALAECDRCGARMPLREAFSREALLASAIGPRLMALTGPCTCGGTLREDLATTIRAIREALEADRP
jgi:hypothetical protein